MDKRAISDLFKKFGADISGDDIWQVQSATVIKHKALERLAVAAKIEFGAPQVLRAERDEAVIIVTGTLDGRCEWSIGEALVNVNYRVSGKQAAYVYAMAEKRAKDRVILKLAGLHGLYSEDEADDFKISQDTNTARGARSTGGEAPRSSPATGAPSDSPAEGLIRQLEQCKTLNELQTVWKRIYSIVETMDADEAEYVTKAKDIRKADLTQVEQVAA